jgi:Glycosyl transferases group 1
VPEVDFVVSQRAAPATRELADTLCFELGRQDMPAIVSDQGFPEAAEGRISIVIDPLGYVRAEGPDALPDDATLRRAIFVCEEAPPSSADEAGVELLKRAGAVFVLDQRGAVALQRLGLGPRLLRPGYSTSLDHFGDSARRPLDVLLEGSPSARQAPFVRRAVEILSRRGRSVRGGASFDAAKRSEDLAHATIVLNLHRGDDPRLEWRRVLDAVLSGTVVVSEQSDGLSPLVAGEHLVVGGPDALAYLADALLSDAERVERMRIAAYERVRDWLPYALPVSVLRAAIVELVSEPVAADA